MRRVLLAGASLAVLLASANVKAAELVVSTDTPLSENVTFGTGQTYDSFSNKDNALYGFDASDTENHNITFGTGTTGVNLTGNGSKASGIATNGQLTIDAGTFNVSNTGSDVYDNTTQLAGYRGVTVTGGEINLGKGTAMFSGLAGDSSSLTASNVSLNGGTVNLNGGVILAPSNETAAGAINVAGATVNANSGRLVSKTTNVNSGALNINGAVDLYGNKANDATDATLNVSGGSFNLNNAELNAGNVAVNITGGTNTVTGNNTVTGDVTINTAGNLTLTKGSSLEFGAGKLTIDGTTGASGSAQRNGIAGIVENDAPLGEVTLNGTTANITGGGNIEVDKLSIKGGEISVSGTGTNLNVPSGEDWRKGSIISGTTSLDMTGGKVTLGENGQMITYENGSINLSGGEVVLNGGSGTEAILRASNGIDNPTSKINIDGAKVTVSGYGIIDSVDTTLSSGSLEIANGGNLALVTNMGEAKTADGSSTRADAIPGVLKVAGGSVSNAGKVSGTVDLNEGSYTSEAGSTLDTLNQSGGTAENSGTITTAELTGGTFDNKTGATVTTANLGGTAFTNSGTVTTANLSSGIFNAESGSTVTTLAMTGGNYNLNGDSTITNASAVDGGTLNLGTNKLTASGGLTVSNQAVINTTVANTADGNGLVNGNIDGTLTVKEDPSGKATMNLIVANGTDLSKGNITVNTNAEIAENMMYDFTKTADGVYTATKADTAAKVSQYGATGNEAAVLAAFSGMAADGKSTGSSVGDAIANAMAQDLQKANGSGVANAAAQADQMIPMAASVAVNVSTENATQILNAVDNELTGFNLSQGRSSGDTFRRVNAWIKGLFNRADYEKTSNHKGYKADNDGLVAGIDGMVSDTVKLGAGYSFISSDIKSGGKKTTADTHTAILYGQYKPSDLYFNAIGTYGWGKYKSKASAYGYGLGGKYDVNTIGAQLMAGYDMGFFAPEAGFRYFNVKQKKHTDNAGQTIGKNSNDVLTAVVGVKYQGTYCLNSNWSLKPNARLAVTYDLMSDKENSVVSLANGSGYVVDGQRLKRLGLEVGAGIAADLNENLEIGLSYEGKFRDNYTDNTGLIEARYKF